VAGSGSVCSGSGLTSGSGRVAVAGEDGRWQCGHFDRWQVGNPFFRGVAVAGSGCVCSGSGLTSGSGRVAVEGAGWGWQCGHFEWWQVDNPFLWRWQWLGGSVCSITKNRIFITKIISFPV
jgi:hypothetical protein